MDVVEYFAVDREGIIEFGSRFGDCAAFAVAEGAALVCYFRGKWTICNIPSVEEVC